MFVTLTYVNNSYNVTEELSIDVYEDLGNGNYNYNLDTHIPHVIIFGVYHKVHDTSEIMYIYLQRPESLFTQSFGTWFANAYGLDNPALLNTNSTSRVKQIIIEGHYNILSLEPLYEYNRKNQV